MEGYATLGSVSRTMFLVLACSFFFSPAVSQILDLNEGAPCEALGGESGTCQLITECYNPGNFKEEHPPICTFRGKIPIICCPDSTGIKEEDFRFKYGSNKAAQFCKNHTASCKHHRQNAGSDFSLEGNAGKALENNFMAIIGYGDAPNQIWKCSGTVITPRFILSAASCAEPKELGPATWARIHSLEKFNNNNNNNNNKENGWLTIFITDRILYPDYKEDILYNDIALFQLQKDLTFNMWIGPVCLHNGRLVKGQVAAIVWGTPQAKQNIPELMDSKMIIDDNNKCQRLTPANALFPSGVQEPLMFCASVESYHPDVCPVETAGGPILIREEGECLATQIGVASYRRESCGETNYPTVYTRVSQYLSWIEGIVFHVLNI